MILMMNREEQWMLPEGVEELLPERAAVIEQLRRQLLDLYASWGYELVFPPLIEFLESLLNGAGRDLERETFKLTDQLSGRLMGVRADITPQVARMDAHSLRRQGPSRLCYCSTALRTWPAGPGGSRIPYQIGVELFGHGGVDSDAEVVLLMLETLQHSGLEGVTLDVGHVGIFRELVSRAELGDDDTEALTDTLVRKARAELEEFLAGRTLPDAVNRALEELPWLAGDAARVLPRARELLAGMDTALQALDELEALTGRVRQQAPAVEIHLDPGELRGYHYHTGCLFAAYVQGLSEPVAKGGRYDRIGRVFGRARPATGFSADIKLLANGRRAPARTGILAPHAPEDTTLREQVRSLREQGERVVQALPGESAGPGESGCDRELVFRDGRWQAVSVKENGG